MYFLCDKVYFRMKAKGRKHPQALLNSIILAVFCYAMKNSWKIPCISNAMNNIIGQELDGGKAPSAWEKYEYQFPRFSSQDGVFCIFPCYGKLMGKLMHVSCYEIYHKMVTGWGKSTSTMGKALLPIPQVLFIPWNLLRYGKYGKYGKFI